VAELWRAPGGGEDGSAARKRAERGAARNQSRLGFRGMHAVIIGG
jgi:hypothetical protein